MRLRKPCKHDRYDKHRYREVGDDGERQYSNDCPGGEFLPEDALVIEKENGKWPEWATTVLYGMIRRDLYPESYVLDGLAKAAPDQVGEPGECDSCIEGEWGGETCKDCNGTGYKVGGSR